MQLQIIPFEVAHLDDLQARRFEAQEIQSLGDYRERAGVHRQLGPAWTGIIDGQVMGCCGLIVLWQGVAEPWMVSTGLCARYALSFHRAIKKGLDQVIQDLRLRRVQVAIHKDHVISHKWVERLGFKREGAMPAYGPDGSDYVRFGRVICPRQ